MKIENRLNDTEVKVINYADYGDGMIFDDTSWKVFEQSIQRISSSVFIVFYCGYLLTYLTKLTQFQNDPYFVFLHILCTCFFGFIIFRVLIQLNMRRIQAASATV